MNSRRAPIRSMRTGASALCLATLLVGCGTLPSLLPTNRIVVACPVELQYQPRRSLPSLPSPLTNDGLAEFALSLVVQIRQGWAQAEQARNDCYEWERSQGVKR